MGAGNPSLSSFDDDKYEPTTYFLDLDEDFDEVAKRLEEELGEEPGDDEVYREIGELGEMHFEDLIESICSELKHTAWDLKSRANGFSELSSAFRQEGLVITETGAEYNHLPIAVIPNFKFEKFKEDAEWEMWDKQDWYRARGKDWDAAVEKLADRAWEKEMKEFRKEAETVLKTLYKWYGEKMRCRAGAWCSGPVDLVGLAA
jgi:hypothetical protein